MLTKTKVRFLMADGVALMETLVGEFLFRPLIHLVLDIQRYHWLMVMELLEDTTNWVH